MGRTAVAWTPERRAEHGRRSLEGRRAAEQARRLRPVHVQRYLEQGVVEATVAPYLQRRGEDARRMLEDLGGAEQLSQAQIAAVEGWLMAQVSADLLFALLLQNGSERYAERISSPLNTARAMLQLIGLQRAERPVESLASYFARRSGASAAPEVPPEDEPPRNAPSAPAEPAERSAWSRGAGSAPEGEEDGHGHEPT